MPSTNEAETKAIKEVLSRPDVFILSRNTLAKKTKGFIEYEIPGHNILSEISAIRDSITNCKIAIITHSNSANYLDNPLYYMQIGMAISLKKPIAIIAEDSYGLENVIHLLPNIIIFHSWQELAKALLSASTRTHEKPTNSHPAKPA